MDDIRPSPFQPRGDASLENLEHLAECIRTQGILQPLLVRRVAGSLELVAGERRWRAARMADLKTVPVRVMDVGDQEAAVIALAENLAREQLTAYEEAAALQELRTLREAAGDRATVEELAAATGRSVGSVSESLRIGRALTPEVMELAELRTSHLSTLPKTALLSAAKAEDPAITARLLRLAVTSDAPGVTVARSAPAPRGAASRARPPKPFSLSTSRNGGVSFRLLVKPEELPPGDATRALDRLRPLIAALEERARAGEA